MAYNSCVTYFSKSHWYSNSSELHQGCTKYNQMGLQEKKKKSAKNYKTLNRKESDILRSPMESVLSDCLNTSVLLSFPVQFVENRTQVSCTLTQRSIILSLPKAFEVVTKTCPVSLSWLPSWLTQKWHVKGAFANPLTSF